MAGASNSGFTLLRSVGHRFRRRLRTFAHLRPIGAPTVDADGVALAVIQGLKRKAEAHTAALETRSRKIESEHAAWSPELADLKQRVELLTGAESTRASPRGH